VVALFLFQEQLPIRKENPTMYVLFIPSAIAFVLIAITQIVSEMRGASVCNI
jgi:hypothetical protein